MKVHTRSERNKIVFGMYKTVLIFMSISFEMASSRNVTNKLDHTVAIHSDKNVWGQGGTTGAAPAKKGSVSA